MIPLSEHKKIFHDLKEAWVGELVHQRLKYDKIQGERKKEKMQVQELWEEIQLL